MKKKGISPVIATVLLIAIVVIIALIVFLWFRSMTKEATTKFDKNIELVCNDVSFDADYSGVTLNIVNTGNVPIFKIKARTYDESGYTTEELDGWPSYGLNQGGAYSGSLDAVNADKIVLIPVLMGSSKSGQKSFVCDEKAYGYEINVG